MCTDKFNDENKTKFLSSFHYSYSFLNPLSANITKWSNTLKQFVGNLPTNCLSVFDHFVRLALKGLIAENCKVCDFEIFGLSVCLTFCKKLSVIA